MRSSTTAIASRSISTADERRYSHATGWIGRSALPRLPARSPYRAKPSSMARWWLSMRDAPISPNCRLSWLQAGKAASSTMPSHLLWRNGDLRKLPQIERKQLLSDLLGENDIELSVLS